MTPEISPSPVFLAQCLSYDELTGYLTWKERPRSHFPSDRVFSKFNNEFAGRTAGVADHGYIRLGLTVEGKCHSLYAHRAAWCLKTGLWPSMFIDHVNGEGTDNKWGNLREATLQQNLRNVPVRSHSKTGIKGVRVRKDGIFEARISLNKKTVYLGAFPDSFSASMAFAKRAQLEHGAFIHQSLQKGGF